ncbi:MAG: FmdE family protein [Candidatus Promineifilaceae bacterium]
MSDLQAILDLSSSWHKHLCPRQVLGVRMGLAGAAALGLAIPQRDKRLLALVETDGCFSSGVEAATGCSMHHRTMRLVDYGKIAVTFVDVKTGTAVRISPQPEVREKALVYAPQEKKHYFAQLVGYQRMPDAELLTIQPVRLVTPVEKIVSRPVVRVNCAACGEEIINHREVLRDGQAYCQGCAETAYYEQDVLLFTVRETAVSHHRT